MQAGLINIALQGFGVCGLGGKGFKVQHLGFRVQDLGFRVEGAQDLGSRVRYTSLNNWGRRGAL